MQRLTVCLTVCAFSLTAVPSAWCDKNPAGGFFGPGGDMPHATEGSGAPVGPQELPSAPPAGWSVSKALPVNPNVRRDLTLNTWTISDTSTGQVVGRWEWDTGRQNFMGSYTNGAHDVLRFEEWNSRGRIALSGYNNFGLRVHFAGTQYDTYAEGTATADTQPVPFTWQWRADTGATSQATQPGVRAAPSTMPSDKRSAGDDLSNFFDQTFNGDTKDTKAAARNEEIHWNTHLDAAAGLAWLSNEPLVLYFVGPKGILPLEGYESFVRLKDKAALVLIGGNVPDQSKEEAERLERQFAVKTYPTFIVARVRPDANDDINQYEVRLRCSDLPEGECPSRITGAILSGQ